MATPDELRAALDTGRTAMREAIEAAEMGWRTTGGGDTWSAQQTAEHTIEIEAFFTTAMCEACGYPGVDVVRPGGAFVRQILSAGKAPSAPFVKPTAPVVAAAAMAPFALALVVPLAPQARW